MTDPHPFGSVVR